MVLAYIKLQNLLKIAISKYKETVMIVKELENVSIELLNTDYFVDELCKGMFFNYLCLV